MANIEAKLNERPPGGRSPNLILTPTQRFEVGRWALERSVTTAM